MSKMIILKKNYSLIFFAGLFIILLNSCNTVRRVLKEPLKEEGADFLFEKLNKNEVKYEWLSARFNASIDYNGKKNSFNGIIRVRKDSTVWVSVIPLLGIEAVRIVISQDSIKVLNRFEKLYIKSDFGYINKMINSDFDYDMIESLLVGNDLSYYDNDKFKAKIDNKLYKLSTVNRQKIKRFIKHSEEKIKIQLQDIWLDPDNFKITKTEINEFKENRKLQVNYSDFKEINKQLFPHKLDFILMEKNPVSVHIKYSKVVFNEAQSFPFKIPSDYFKL